MLKDRSFNVKLVRDTETITSSQPINFDKVITKLTRSVVTVVVVYVGADTLRRAAIYAMSAKI